MLRMPTTTTTQSSTCSGNTCSPTTLTTTTTQLPSTATTLPLPSMQHPQQQEQQMSTLPPRSFYRRELPEETCVALSSARGRAYFASALSSKGLRSFFPLIEQFSTQSDPAYCGVSTLVVVLNALAVDPRQTWKGPWRWYEESMLNCCIDLDQVKTTGITLAQFDCLAFCQGLVVRTHRVPPKIHETTTQPTETETESIDQNNNILASLQDFRRAVQQACMEIDEEVEEEEKVNNSVTSIADSGVSGEHGPSHHTSHQVHGDAKRSNPKNTILVVSYSRKVLRQTGDGHFSPIGAYDPASDSVLIMDTARFKYGPHWVKLPLLWEAMRLLDPATGLPRGYVLLSFPGDDDDDADKRKNNPNNTTTRAQSPAELHPPMALTWSTPAQSILFQTKMADYQVRRDYYNYLQSLPAESIISWQQVVSFWTKNGTNPKYIWTLLHPQLSPVNVQDCQAVATLRKLIHHLLQPHLIDAQPSDDFTNQANQACWDCRPNFSRTLDLSPHEAMFVVYLASLPNNNQCVYNDLVEDESLPPMENTTTNDKEEVDEITWKQAKMQLQSEADLIRFALQVHDDPLL